MAKEEEVLAIPLVEERVTVGKRTVETGKVRVRAQVERHIDIARVQLDHERVQITRVPKDEEVALPPDVREEGEVTIFPVVEERLVVTKRLVLVEEVHIKRVRTSEEARQPVELARQRAIVEREEIRGNDQA